MTATAVVYILCTLTSLLCAALLLRAYRHSRGAARLLLWSGLCFVGLALNNALLFVDRQIVPEVSLRIFRIIPAFLGVLCLLWGLIWEEAS